VDIEIYRLNDEHAMAMCGPLSFIVWRGPTISVEDIRATERHARAALERSPEGIGLLAFAEAATPAREVRRVSTQINAQLHASGAVGVAAVLSRRGLVAAVQRGMATGMAMLAPRTYPLRVFAHGTEACRWLGDNLRARGVSLDVEAAATEIDDFRRLYLREGTAVRAG
jgi:hypothetical protein